MNDISQNGSSPCQAKDSVFSGQARPAAAWHVFQYRHRLFA
jgi:hypothetical protein